MATYFSNSLNLTGTYNSGLMIGEIVQFSKPVVITNVYSVVNDNEIAAEIFVGTSASSVPTKIKRSTTPRTSTSVTSVGTVYKYSMNVLLADTSKYYAILQGNGATNSSGKYFQASVGKTYTASGITVTSRNACYRTYNDTSPSSYSSNYGIVFDFEPVNLTINSFDRVVNTTNNTLKVTSNIDFTLKLTNGTVDNATSKNYSAGTHTITVVGNTKNGFGNHTITATLSANSSSSNVYGTLSDATSKTLNFYYDEAAPTISFPQETYNTQHYEGETVTLFTASDNTDNTLDWDYKVYVDDTLYSSYTTVNHNTLKLPYFENMPESYQLRVEVRARQSADTTNGTGQDIWSEWHTSPTITIKSPVLFIPNFTSLKWYQDIEQQAILSPFTEFETQHWCNGEFYTTTQHRLGLTPPLLYTPIKPHLWMYEYYAMTRVKNTEGVWSGWYKSPTVEIQFNVQPNDIEFNKALPPYLIQGEITTVEWGESIDLNSTKTTYTVSLMNNVTEEIFEYAGITENRLTFTTPRDIISDKVTFNVVAYSDGLYSNPVSSPQLAITDVNVMDCTLDFPILTTNVTGQFQNIILEINGDRRITKLENIVDYELPIHYFRSGLNTLKLIATDRNGVEVNRTWKINLDLNKEDLVIQKGKVNVEGYLSFNYDPQENYVECAKIGSNNLDLGIEEYELYGSTPFEGATNVTQKLVITRDNDDDLTQVRTLKITGAIE